ncbi:hypothetical protein [Cutibacterium sp. V947]|uniref:hypothetical protein n=1 Tax=unclassified Cutibacterium TaxID=2649671 RepID=UPI003EE3F3DD
MPLMVLVLVGLAVGLVLALLADEPTPSLDTEKVFDVAESLADQTHPRGTGTEVVQTRMPDGSVQ